MNAYKRFWGNFIWKHGGKVSWLFFGLVVFCGITWVSKHPFQLDVPCGGYIISTSLIVTVFIFLHLIHGGKWKRQLPEYKFSQVMKRARRSIASREVYGDAYGRLTFLINKAKVGDTIELENWMSNFEKHERLVRYIANLKEANASIPVAEEVLLKTKKALQI